MFYSKSEHYINFSLKFYPNRLVNKEFSILRSGFEPLALQKGNNLDAL